MGRRGRWRKGLYSKFGRNRIKKGSHLAYLLNQVLTKGHSLDKDSPGGALPCHKISMLCDSPKDQEGIFKYGSGVLCSKLARKKVPTLHIS